MSHLVLTPVMYSKNYHLQTNRSVLISCQSKYIRLGRRQSCILYLIFLSLVDCTSTYRTSTTTLNVVDQTDQDAILLGTLAAS